MNKLQPFYIRLFIITLIIAALYYGLSEFRPDVLSHSSFGWLLSIFTFISGLFHYGLSKAEQKGGPAFVRFYMGATTFKLFLYMALIIVYAFFIDQNTRSFIILFFLLYLIYTGFEVSFIYRKLSRLKKHGKDSNLS